MNDTVKARATKKPITRPAPPADMTAVQRLTRDIRSASITLGDDEARFLVDAYYTMQEDRKRSANQLRSLSESGEPNATIGWLFDQTETMEAQIKRALQAYVEAHPIGQRMLQVVGIGPVIAAGLLAHIDIEKAPTVGHIWRFGGMDPTCQWEKGQKRPWNADLKRLCWLIGESFVKQKSRENDYYGKVYEARKAYEQAKNLNGDYADQAKALLAKRPNHAQRAIYAEGRLPDGHIHARAKRYAVKLFLAHLWEIWYVHHFKKAPPLPYPIAHLGHVDFIAPPF
jgi:hypothetical protein